MLCNLSLKLNSSISNYEEPLLESMLSAININNYMLTLLLERN